MSLSLYSFVLFIHVLAGAFLIGSSLGAPLVRRAVEASVTFAELRRWLDFGHRSHKANPLAALILLASGVYLGASGWWSSGWFYIALVAWIVNSALAGLVIDRTAAKIVREISLSEGSIPGTLDVTARTTAWQIADHAMIANNVSLLYLMMMKPSAAMSVTLIAGANVVALAAAVLARRRAGRLQVASRQTGVAGRDFCIGDSHVPFFSRIRRSSTSRFLSCRSTGAICVADLDGCFAFGRATARVHRAATIRY